MQSRITGIVMKRTRTIILSAAALAAACLSLDASAHADIGVYLGIPGPVYEAPPPVVYEAPPPVYYAPPPPVVYGYGYPSYGGEYWDDEHHHHWHEHEHEHEGGHRGWEHHHDHDD
jgi:hypothetical protein